jgi:general secretion pathway protein D
MTAVSDDRTNSVIVTAPTEMLKAISDVVTKLDSNPVSEEELFVYRLENSTRPTWSSSQHAVRQLLPARAERRPERRPPAAAAAVGRRRPRRPPVARPRPRLAEQQQRRPPQRPQRQHAQISQGLTRAFTELTGEVFVVADTDTNSLLVTTASKYQQQVRKLIGELDRPVPQVLIKVLVAEVTHDDNVDYGTDFSILNRRPNGNGQTIGTNFGTAAATGGLVVSVLEENVTATIRALAGNGKLDVLSRPYILASDNQLASILVGQEVPRISDSEFINDRQVNRVIYEDVGIILDVTPHINPDGQVILDVAPEISQLTEGTVEVISGVKAPIFNVRSAESRVEVTSGQTVVIGGLMEDRKTRFVDKVPLLGDLPLLRYAFSRTRQTKTKTELLIFLTPHVAERPEALEGMSEDEMGGTTLTPGAVEPGMFHDHMRNMKRGAMPLTRPGGPDADSYVPTTGPANGNGEGSRNGDEDADAPTTQPSNAGAEE